MAEFATEDVVIDNNSLTLVARGCAVEALQGNSAAAVTLVAQPAK
ncbi:hypothetical protein [Enterobacter sp.]|nr:hypothetical protein [Enterobacter sp.]